MVKVIGLGDNVVDKYEHIRTMYPGGNALNFAAYAKKLGANSAFLGVFGSDAEAEHVQNIIHELDLDISRCRYFNGENGCARVTLEDGDRVFLGSNEGGVLRENGLNLTQDDLDYIKTFDLLHAGLYGYTEPELDKIRALSIPISFDFSDDFSIEEVERIAPKVDFSFFSCSHLKTDEMLNLIMKAHKLGSKIVVVTMGEKGALLYDGTKFYSQEPELVEAVDTMGAGDSFITAFLVNYISKIKENELDRETIIKESLNEGAIFSAKTCLVEGSFGYGKKY
ncbi:fructoselysine 6-kinase [Clostridium beijerinckii]|uniref:fructoselysine 6-kinase n=1 Tax=Clostridium beijerinckii TaxID=1520 RepID=UPI0015711760|nr:fructoselysine 6-kinase [Clostridium beijerinckii]NRT37557.1 sugar/nucleoside kinase (ribokinase family) [Clostridium beijerinckii]NRT48701.1 sugar/nucleoside kinase (ribokinase family) [Clostridium beijerinckii]NRZ23004.1 sugar/nucleoside kinase (ribokinase family) [Clostridium beijerinckii]UYZ34768.1 fructoselysine 6-kinase [Clostridium beijerinckii]